MSAESKNLAAIDQHNAGCEAPLVAIEMCAFEIDRLGWDEFRGIPLRIADLPTGRFRLVCENDLAETTDTLERTEAVSV